MKTMIDFMIWTAVALAGACLFFCAGLVYGTYKENEAAEKRCSARIRQRYSDPVRGHRGSNFDDLSAPNESGLAAHTVAIGLLICGAAYIAGSVMTWVVMR